MLNIAKRSVANFRQKVRDLEVIQNNILACQECHLHKVRKNVLPGRFVEPAEAVVVDLMPHETEDATGVILEGSRGKGLERLFGMGSPSLDLKKMSYVTAYKCRGDAGDSLRCLEYVSEQIRVLDPIIVLGLGQETTQRITGRSDLQNGKMYVTGEAKQFAFVPLMHPREVMALKEKNIPIWKQHLDSVASLAMEYDLKIFTS